MVERDSVSQYPQTSNTKTPLGSLTGNGSVTAFSGVSAILNRKAAAERTPGGDNDGQ